MNMLRIFGIGSSRILKMDHSVTGTVTDAKRCWWMRMKTKPARLYASEENTVYSYFITFEYSVDNANYTGKLYIDFRYRVPQKGELIQVYYDPEKPADYACYAFGPGTTQISW